MIDINFKVFAIILNYNSAAETIELSTILKNFNLEYLRILVIDNASKEEDQNKLKENILAENLIFSKKNLGYAGGNNIGIEIALNENADYILILNPDIRLDGDTLPILLQTLILDEKLAAVGPRIVKRVDPEIIYSDGGKVEFDHQCSTYHKNYLSPTKGKQAFVNYEIDYIDGSCILINMKAIEMVGVLPEEYFLYYEETDWCLNAKRNGWKIAVNSNVKAYNLISFKGPTYFYYQFRNRIIFSKKYHPKAGLVQLYYLQVLARDFFKVLIGHQQKWLWKTRLKGFVDAQKK